MKRLIIPALAIFATSLHAQELSLTQQQLQPVRVNLNRVVQALDYIGWPVVEQAPADLKAIEAAFDPYCIATVTISPESRVSAEPGPWGPKLVGGEWSYFLVKVINEAGVTAPLAVVSQEPEVAVGVFGDRPMNPRLSGAKLEYRILLAKVDTAGPVSTVLTFDVGQGSQDIGFRSDLLVNFQAEEAIEVFLRPIDEKGEPTTAAFEIRDAAGKSWPTQLERVEPDFRFHPQVYRVFGESVNLVPGDYTFHVSRGPEYLPLEKKVTINADRKAVDFKLERWIDPSEFGWWSGDHHIHAAGCKHYESPSEGVHADAMLRHCQGEDLKVGANLTWGPCFDYQKQFFTGKVDEVSTYPYLLRYDVEVSGFGSHRSGHLCLLRLNDQIYPGGDSSEHWPTLCLNTLKWAQKQGAVCGPAHSGWGLAVESSELPNYEIPPYDGIGANEYIVDVTHMVEGPDGTEVPAVDFLSTVDTPYVWELNIWYHTLNCGYRTRISGETDFPCIYGERVGLGRSYIKLDGKLNYDAWCQGIADGRGYVSDGRSHIMDFSVNDHEVGTQGSEVTLDEPGTISVRADVAGFLKEETEELSEIPHGRLLRDKPKIAELSHTKKPYWHIERARIGDSREVTVELVVNGEPVAEKRIAADGVINEVTFDDVPIERSSWVALRILPSSHTNPVFVVVGEKPIRSSRRSAQWCLDSVDQCWSQKEAMIDPAEMADAKAAYAHARETYGKILTESEVE